MFRIVVLFIDSGVPSEFLDNPLYEDTTTPMLRHQDGLVFFGLNAFKSFTRSFNYRLGAQCEDLGPKRTKAE